MKTQRLFVVLTLANLALVIFALAQQARKTRVWGTQNLPYGSSLGHAAQFLSNTILGLFPPLVLAVLQKFSSVVILSAAIAARKQ